MALALPFYVLFISPMRSVNGAQFLYTTSLALVSGFALMVVLVRLIKVL